MPKAFIIPEKLDVEAVDQYGTYRSNTIAEMQERSMSADRSDKAICDLFNRAPSLLRFVEQIGRMEQYVPISENDGYSGEQLEDAIATMNSLIAEARTLASTRKQPTPKPIKLTKTGKMRCPHCKTLERPGVRENGYSIKHHVLEIDAKEKEIRATGGDSSNFSDEGDSYVFECQCCFAEFPMPDDWSIDWV
jgi:hypothetical protein